MNVEQILKEIKSGLTGIGHIDVEYLLSMAKKYQTHDQGILILKEIVILLANYISDEDSEKIKNAFSNEEVEVMLSVLDVEQKALKGDFEGALEILEHEIVLLEKKYKNTDDVEWHSFEEPIQEILFDLLFETNREVKVCNMDLSNVYAVYGELLLKSGNVEKAMDAYDRALVINPLNLKVFLSQIELLWNNGKKLDATMTLYSGFRIAYTPEALSKLYDIYGDMNLSRKNKRRAYYSYYLASIYNEDDESILEKMEEIQKGRKRKLKDLFPDDLEREFDGFIPIGPDEQIVEILETIAKMHDEKGEYEPAIYFYDYLYNLTGDEEINKIMNSIYSMYLEDKLEEPIHLMS